MEAWRKGIGELEMNYGLEEHVEHSVGALAEHLLRGSLTILA